LPAPRARLAGNTASIRLLEKCGFEHEGPVVYDGDEYVLLVLRRR
jgi:RimJ/RimL family protein N-acetyltransferase